MGNKQNKNKFSEFFERHKKAIKIYNIIIWTVLIIMGIMISFEGRDKLTQEEMQQQVEERCDNEVIFPSSGLYAVKFNHNSLLNVTNCEVIMK